MRCIPLRFNIKPEIQPLKRRFRHVGNHHFQVPAVTLWGCFPHFLERTWNHYCGNLPRKVDDYWSLHQKEANQTKTTQRKQNKTQQNTKHHKTPVVSESPFSNDFGFAKMPSLRLTVIQFKAFFHRARCYPRDTLANVSSFGLHPPENKRRVPA